MARPEPHPDNRVDTPPAAAQFATTHWSAVLSAQDCDLPQATEALEKLCRTYWYPLYAYVRRRGHAPHDAEDLTQAFFMKLLEKRGLASVGPEKGRFRSFLLASMNHFLTNEWDRRKAEKRGGKLTFLSLDDESPESRFAREDVADVSAERAFDRGWAIALLRQAMDRLQAETASAGKDALFARLKAFLQSEPAPGEYEGVAAELGWTQGAVAVAVHRLRGRYRQLVTEQVAETVAAPAEVEDELRQLFAALG
jgi:RNA polymerase sigma-70 factor (ECF subfamily)